MTHLRVSVQRENSLWRNSFLWTSKWCGILVYTSYIENVEHYILLIIPWTQSNALGCFVSF